MKKLWEKLQQIKHWEIYAAVIVLAIMLGIYFSSLHGGRKTSEPEHVATVTNVDNSYAGQLENKLQNVLGCIAGAGHVAVMVMTDGAGSAELAYDLQEKTITQTGANTQEVKTTTVDKNVVTKNGSPVVLWTNPPKIVGVVVVATGANNVGVRLNLLHAVETVLGDQNVPIQILSGI
ncbi:MAG: hypothetical protein KIG16_02335 [Eubacteriales bacterium]|nr:hypothetical protein [Eubacteriales bacterium]